MPNPSRDVHIIDWPDDNLGVDVESFPDIGITALPDLDIDAMPHLDIDSVPDLNIASLPTDHASLRVVGSLQILTAIVSNEKRMDRIANTRQLADDSLEEIFARIADRAILMTDIWLNQLGITP